MAAQTIVISPPSTPFTAGVHPFGPISVPVGAFAAEAHLAAGILLSATLVLSAGFELSQDSGVTWLSCGSAGLTSNGTIPVNPKTHLPMTDWWVRVQLDNPANANRQVRGSVTINELVSTFINVVLES
jgi:hypothetical protein